MKIFNVLVLCSFFTLYSHSASEDPTLYDSPFEWNARHMKRTIEAYEAGGASEDDIQNVIRQMYIKLKEEEAEGSLVKYIEVYYPWVFPTAYFATGVLVGAAAVVYLRG